jgi:DNA-binding transcriptional MerR regulator
VRISELSRSAGVPVDTIKYYLRAGLLPEGRRTSATQAQYDVTHLDRLRLIRALTGVAGLSLATTRQVLDHLEDPPASTHRLLEQVDELLGPEPEVPADTAEAEAIVDAMGWDLKITSPAPLNRLALALAAIGTADFAPGPGGRANVRARCGGPGRRGGRQRPRRRRGRRE